jgi:alkylated DNA repair dioxygenase AlkB
MLQEFNFLDRITLENIIFAMDKKNLGVIYLPNFLTNQEIELLQIDTSFLERTLKQASKEQGPRKVKQNAFTRYIGEGDTSSTNDQATRDSVKNIINCLRGYSQIYSKLDTSWTNPNSVGLHKYPPEDGGIEYHRDYKLDANLIAIFSIKGQAIFTTAEDAQGKNEEKYNCNPGDLVLMRGTQEKKEINKNYDPRPWHSVKVIGESPRYSLIFRTRINDVKC